MTLDGSGAALLLWLILVVIVAIGELLPGSSAPLQALGATGFSDKSFHFAAYTLLAAIPVFGFQLRTGIWAACSMIFLGAGLDIAQKLVPGRSFDLGDILANTIGVLAGIALGLLGRILWTAPVR